MGKISTYTVLSTPTLNDKLIGTDVTTNNETKNIIDNQNILNSIASALKYGHKKWKRSKIMIVGEGRAGTYIEVIILYTNYIICCQVRVCLQTV